MSTYTNTWLHSSTTPPSGEYFYADGANNGNQLDVAYATSDDTSVRNLLTAVQIGDTITVAGTPFTVASVTNYSSLYYVSYQVNHSFDYRFVDGNPYSLIFPIHAPAPSPAPAPAPAPAAVFTPSNGTQINVYKYESFDVSFAYTGASSYDISDSVSSIPFSTFKSPISNYVDLSSSQYNGTVSLGNTLVINARDSSANILATASYPFNFNASRFLQLNNPTSLNLYVGEPMTPLIFQTQQLAINQPIPYVNGVSRSLPLGLLFLSNDSNSWTLYGNPLLPSISQAYTFSAFGTSNTSAVVTSNLPILVNPQRVQLFPPGPTISFNGLQVQTPISNTTITASLPSTALGFLQYSWTSLPAGFSFTDINGSNISGNSFSPRDASYTIILTGTPNTITLSNFQSSGNLCNVILTATGSSQISNSLGFQFSFGKSVIINILSNFPNLYTGVYYPHAGLLSAGTYFGSTSTAIANIFSIDLHSDLSTNFYPSTSTMDISGTPTVSRGTQNYTFRAIDANGLSNDIAIPISITQDTVDISTNIDASATFILSRPVSNAYPGYYNYPYTFTASASSGNVITFSAPALDGTGMSLSSPTVSGNKYTTTLIGTPVQVDSLASLVVKATSAVTDASISYTSQFSIVPDTVTINPFTVTFYQNIPTFYVNGNAVSQYQLTGTSVSGRSVTTFVSSDLPTGLSLTTSGILSGALQSDLSGSFTVFGSTGYSSGSIVISYTTIPDSIVVVSPVSSVPLTLGGEIGPVQLQGVSFSGTSISNFQLTDGTQYGLTIGNTTGIVGGTFTPYLSVAPALCNFEITTQAGTITQGLPTSIVTQNPYANRSFIALQNVVISNYEDVSSSIYYSDDMSNWYPYSIQIPLETPITDTFTQLSPNEIDYVLYPSPIQSTFSNSLLPPSFSFNNIDRYTNGPFSNLTYASSPLLRSITKDGSGNLWGVGGTMDVCGTFVGFLYVSTDNANTWIIDSQLPIPARPTDPYYYPRSDPNNVGYSKHFYRSMGMVLRGQSNVLLLGGQDVCGSAINSKQYTGVSGTYQNGTTHTYGMSNALLRRSLNQSNWTKTTNSLQSEIAGFNLDVSGMWISYGSDSNYTFSNYDNSASHSNSTIRYSTDTGLTWSNTANDFNFFCYEVVYGNNMWIASGTDEINTIDEFDNPINLYVPGLRYSLDGISWSNFDVSNTQLGESYSSNPKYPCGVGPIMFNGSNWYIFRNRFSNNNDINFQLITEIYSHDLSSSFVSNWNRIDVSASFPNITTLNTDFSTSNARTFFGFTPQRVMETDGLSPISSLVFSNYFNGPVFTSPINTNYIFYQYCPIPTIQFSATGSGNIYFFAKNVPLGLTFDPIRGTITGMPVLLGSQTIVVYAKDNNGVTTMNLTTNTIIPQILKKQDGAGAYTSYIRQYTEVNAAEDARDNEVYPNQTQKLGEFMSPAAPDVISSCTKCGGIGLSCGC